MALALDPVLCTVSDTAIITVISVAHTRRGARSIVAAASAPGAPKARAHAARPADDRSREGETQRDLAEQP